MNGKSLTTGRVTLDLDNDVARRALAFNNVSCLLEAFYDRRGITFGKEAFWATTAPIRGGAPHVSDLDRPWPHTSMQPVLFIVEHNAYQVHVRDACSISGINMFVPVEFGIISWEGTGMIPHKI